jgi:hypothetical protein
VTLQVWKLRGERAARVTFRCPWCDVTGISEAHGNYRGAGAFWLLAACVDPSCARAVMIRVPSSAPSWYDLDAGADGMLLNRRCMHPRSRPSYDVEGVPTAIARDMVEALRCNASGLFVAAALMALRALDGALVRVGADGPDVLRALRSVPPTVLDVALQELAGSVSLLTADRATLSPAETEVARLIVFAEEVLHNLFVAPARLTTRVS